ncbi:MULTISPECIES: metal ABC transporter permease [Alkalihalophilus]|jgi:zinc transport system permease protein|uniref:Metal ABC transporter permease n=1 Tax=Alkalihalophilus marmarensis DSM 21297 TaxID=1188261 RepID=U6SV54_9BACI|nr:MULTISPECIES: metal ABC transporter permease [Alkalihalophilus]ERN54790.1 metal ABC transporter permease [Alkalihalophilus marmarensis DSM 21297]MCM3488590.1 metal ABC transporter permease [Alkalihalophilus marmarensis]MEC2070504.1 metal ABC transporter permease [Alkalihalophilus marmarensis]WEG18039.1 metal ABC transporter permease [Alkalihalophilus pseudofirmus]
MQELLMNLTFIERGVLAGVLIALICPIVGAFLMVRRVSIISESLSHITLTGISAGVLLGSTTMIFSDLNPMYAGLIFAVAGSLLIEKLRDLYKHFQELAIPIILSAGVGLSAIFMSLSQSGYNEWYAYLFGSIVSVSREDLQFIIYTALIVIGIVILFYKEFISISFDQEYATVSGISVRFMNQVFAILVAFIIAMSMKVVGILLVGAMIVLPVATSIHLSKSFKQVIGFGILFAQIAMLSGVYFSYQFNIATGGMIVVMGMLQLVIVMGVKKIINEWQRRAKREY